LVKIDKVIAIYTGPVFIMTQCRL